MGLRETLNSARTRWWLHECAEVGVNPYLYGRPSIDVYGGTIRIGSRCRLMSKPTVSHFVAGEGAVLEIGDDVWIGHGAAVAAFERVEIGSGTCIGPFVIVMDTNFHSSSGDQSVQHECRPVIIGRNCRIGSRVTITRGVTIGDGARILSGSVVSSSIPAGACAAGARARVIGAAGDHEAQWESPTTMVPLVMQEALALTAAPDQSAMLAALVREWRGSSADRVAVALEAQFGVGLEREQVLRAASVADLVDAVRRAQVGGHRHVVA